jgi:hypothetical protein
MLPPLSCPVYISRQGGGPVITTIEHFVVRTGFEPIIRDATIVMVT